MKKWMPFLFSVFFLAGCSTAPARTDTVSSTVVAPANAVAEGNTFETPALRITLSEAADKTAVVLVEKRFDRLRGVLKQYYTVTDGDALGREEKISLDDNQVITLDFSTGLKIAQVGRDMVLFQAQRREALPDQGGRPAYRVYYVDEERPRPFVLMEDAATGKRFKLIGQLN